MKFYCDINNEGFENRFSQAKSYVTLVQEQKTI